MTVNPACQTDVIQMANSDELIIQLTNTREKVQYAQPVSGNSTLVSGSIPGIYTVNISGKAKCGWRGTLLQWQPLNQPILVEGHRST